jgi:hypothetical protein
LIWAQNPDLRGLMHFLQILIYHHFMGLDAFSSNNNIPPFHGAWCILSNNWKKCIKPLKSSMIVHLMCALSKFEHVQSWYRCTNVQLALLNPMWTSTSISPKRVGSCQ